MNLIQGLSCYFLAITDFPSGVQTHPQRLRHEPPGQHPARSQFAPLQLPLLVRQNQPALILRSSFSR